MFDSLKFLEGRKKQKAVDDPHNNQDDPIQDSWATIIGLSPFAFFHALKRSDGSLLFLLLEAAAALVVYGFIYILFSYFYLEARKMSHPKTKTGSFVFPTFALLISFFITFCFFSRVT